MLSGLSRETIERNQVAGQRFLFKHQQGTLRKEGKWNENVASDWWKNTRNEGWAFQRPQEKRRLWGV